MTTSKWLLTPEDIILDNNDVHVWRCLLTQPQEQVEILQETLTYDEKERAARFKRQQDRVKFIVSRGVLRGILAKYLKTAPHDLLFYYGMNGKPMLAQNSGSTLCFNISHSRDIALFAFTYKRSIGIDIEHINRNSSCMDIAERFFTVKEVTVLRSLPADKQCDAFFTYWTCKEAYLKARGTGLFEDLNKVEISVSDNDQVAIVNIEGDLNNASSWSLQTLDAASGYAAALAVNGHNTELKCWEWNSTE